MTNNTKLLRIWHFPIKSTALKFIQRRKFIVKRRLQYSLLILSLSYALFFMFSVAALLFIPTGIQLHRLEPLSSEASQLAAGILYLHNNYWPTVFLPLAVIALHSIFISHKIAGPLYRFSRIFDAVAQGWLPKPAKLRKGDYLQEEMNQINRMVVGLRTKIEEIKQINENLSEKFSDFRRDIVHGLSEEQLQLLKDLESKRNRLGEKLADFNIES
ncbi:MAG: methyl-accepting chemotaxis protein [Acidobacteria bacterium]|nr:methyl-accepting chemotaxis protein [Acidobacteriota bacterium]